MNQQLRQSECSASDLYRDPSQLKTSRFSSQNEDEEYIDPTLSWTQPPSSHKTVISAHNEMTSSHDVVTLSHKGMTSPSIVMSSSPSAVVTSSQNAVMTSHNSTVTVSGATRPVPRPRLHKQKTSPHYENVAAGQRSPPPSNTSSPSYSEALPVMRRLSRECSNEYENVSLRSSSGYENAPPIHPRRSRRSGDYDNNWQTESGFAISNPRSGDHGIKKTESVLQRASMETTSSVELTEADESSLH